MDQDHSSAAPAPGQLKATRWSVARAVAQSQAPGGRAELLGLDGENSEGRLAFKPAVRLTPETLYAALRARSLP